MKLHDTQIAVKPCMLPHNQLSTGADVVGRIIMLRLEEMEAREVDEFHVSIASIFEPTADEVTETYRRASVPARNRYKVRCEIRKLYYLRETIRRRLQNMKIL